MLHSLGVFVLRENSLLELKGRHDDLTLPVVVIDMIPDHSTFQSFCEMSLRGCPPCRVQNEPLHLESPIINILHYDLYEESRLI